MVLTRRRAGRAGQGIRPQRRSGIRSQRRSGGIRSGNTWRTLRSSSALNALRPLCARITLGPRSASRTRETHISLRAGSPSVTLGTSRARSARCPGVALYALRALRTCRASVTFRTGGTSRTGHALRADIPFSARVSFRPLRSRCPLRPCRSRITLWSLQAHRTRRALCTGIAHAALERVSWDFRTHA